MGPESAAAAGRTRVGPGPGPEAAADAGTALAAEAASLLAAGPGPGESLTALQAAQRLNALCETARALGQWLELRMAQAAWAIRREKAERAAFDAFVRDYVDLSPASAWRLAETWEVVRRNRELRELADGRPREALRLVGDLLDAAGAAGADAAGADERRLAEVAALPKRRRKAALRAMFAALDEARADGAGAERVRAAGGARDGAGRPEPPAAATLDAALAEMLELVGRLGALAEVAEPLLAGAGDGARERAARTADMGIDAMERVAGAATDGGEGA